MTEFARPHIDAAAQRLRGHAHRTPVLTSATLDDRVGADVFVKCENFQRAGAFKFRGAFNAIAALPPDVRARGVATYSSGNHGQAVALAAREFGSRASVLMPLDAPASKVEAVKGYGGTVVTYDRYTQDRSTLAAEMAADAGLAIIPPYDHLEVMAGQGTVGLELIDQAGLLDLVICPLGGGGLMAGLATAVKADRPAARMVGVERVQIDVPRTIADGLAVNLPGELTFAVNRRLVDDVVVVSDAEIVDAMRFLFERMKLVVEPSGAVGIAALLTGRVVPTGRVGVVISGGNVDAARFASLLGDSVGPVEEVVR
jgi:threonine dehydratase